MYRQVSVAFCFSAREGLKEAHCGKETALFPRAAVVFLITSKQKDAFILNIQACQRVRYKGTGESM